MHIINEYIAFLLFILLFVHSPQFAGFPYASRAATRRLSQLSYLGCVWTTTRLGWGLIALTSVLQHWITEARRSTTFYTCTLVLIFLFTEVLPIMVSLQKRVLQSLSEQDEGARGSSRSSAGVGGDRSSSGGGIRYSHIVPAEEEEVYSPSRTSFTIPPAADPAYQPPPSRSSESLTRQSERPTMWHGGWWHLDSDNESVEKGPSTAASPSASPSLWDRLKGLW
ncbi:hypothetical protein EON65_00330 [archaeon]|nr:MAG: hypothetical protein EON65_00330 [archaeon]